MTSYVEAEGVAVRTDAQPVEAADLLFAGQCSARCLLAMDSPPGPGPWCGCVCRGRHHAALIDAPVHSYAVGTHIGGTST